MPLPTDLKSVVRKDVRVRLPPLGTIPFPNVFTTFINLALGMISTPKVKMGPGGLDDSIAVDEDENVYVSDPGTPKILIFSSNGTFQRSFRLPFPSTSITVNRKREIFLTPDVARPPE